MAPSVERKTVSFESIISTIGNLSSTIEKQSLLFEKQSLSLAPIIEDFVKKYYYINDKATKVERNVDFKKTLIQFYFKKHYATTQITCMFSGVELPVKTVIAGHLFKSCWAQSCKSRLGFDDINNPRNGLLLFKPFEYAFDNSHICFQFEAEFETFHMKILKQELREMSLRNYIQTEKEIDSSLLFKTREEWISTMKKNPHLTDEDIETEMIVVDNLLNILDMKFAFFEGKSLIQTEEKCFARCLSFQASMARLLAIENGWITKDEMNSPTMFSEMEEKNKRTLNTWFKSLEKTDYQ